MNIVLLFQPPLYEHAPAVLPEESPMVNRPSPLAIGIIEHFLHEKKMRLLDLFASVDKDKNWRLTRDEFRLALQKVSINRACNLSVIIDEPNSQVRLTSNIYDIFPNILLMLYIANKIIRNDLEFI